ALMSRLTVVLADEHVGEWSEFEQI
ncbi:MAG: hypothetical protein RLZZ426_719, partial [Actinomycetota bacterium]